MLKKQLSPFSELRHSKDVKMLRVALFTENEVEEVVERLTTKPFQN